MRKAFLILLLINVSFIINAQNSSFQNQIDLEINGVITWLDSTRLRVEYDWTDDSQLLDWELTEGSTLVRENGSVTISGGEVVVWAMKWKQHIKFSKLTAQDAAPLSKAGHLNFYCNLTTFTGKNYRPKPGLGAVLATQKSFWTRDGEGPNIGAPFLVVGEPRNYEFGISDSGITIKSSVNDTVYSLNSPVIPSFDRIIAIGGWSDSTGGNTKWGKITIEGEVSPPWHYIPAPSDVINFQSNGNVFAPVIEVVGDPVIEWIFNDSTTSSSAKPSKEYGTSGSRFNYLRVTPWSALTGINIGYDASDDGYGPFDTVANQNVLGFQNLSLAKNSLQYICANYNLLTELDLREFTSLKFIELYRCPNLVSLKLGFHPVLERLVAEDALIDSIDISGCPALADFRSALNKYTTINWGSTGQKLWHICIRDNPQYIGNIPNLTEFPLLRELLIWNLSQTGPFVCNSPVIWEIDAFDNQYTSADVSGTTNLFYLSLSGSPLTSINLGTGYNLGKVYLKNCGLNESQVDYVLNILDVAGRLNGILEISGNEAPTGVGLTHLNNLISRGWTIDYSIVSGFTEEIAPLKIIVNHNEIKTLLDGNYISWKADLYNSRGDLVMSKFVNSDVLIFDISSLPAGVYFEVLSNGKNTEVAKFYKPGK